MFICCAHTQHFVFLTIDNAGNVERASAEFDIRRASGREAVLMAVCNLHLLLRGLRAFRRVTNPEDVPLGDVVFRHGGVISRSPGIYTKTIRNYGSKAPFANSSLVTLKKAYSVAKAAGPYIVKRTNASAFDPASCVIVTLDSGGFLLAVFYSLFFWSFPLIDAPFFVCRMPTLAGVKVRACNLYAPVRPISWSLF